MIDSNKKSALFTLFAIAVVLHIQSGNCSSLLQNIGRELARNQVLHILRHYPNLWDEVIQQLQQQQMQLQFQMQQQSQGPDQNQLTGPQQNLTPAGQQRLINQS